MRVKSEEYSNRTKKDLAYEQLQEKYCEEIQRWAEEKASLRICLLKKASWKFVLFEDKFSQGTREGDNFKKSVAETKEVYQPSFTMAASSIVTGQTSAEQMTGFHQFIDEIIDAVCGQRNFRQLIDTIYCLFRMRLPAPQCLIQLLLDVSLSLISWVLWYMRTWDEIHHLSCHNRW